MNESMLDIKEIEGGITAPEVIKQPVWPVG